MASIEPHGWHGHAGKEGGVRGRMVEKRVGFSDDRDKMRSVGVRKSGRGVVRTIGWVRVKDEISDAILTRAPNWVG